MNLYRYILNQFCQIFFIFRFFEGDSPRMNFKTLFTILMIMIADPALANEGRHLVVKVEDPYSKQRDSGVWLLKYQVPNF